MFIFSAAWGYTSAVFTFCTYLVLTSILAVIQTIWAVLYSLTWPARTFVILPTVMIYSFVVDELSPLLLFLIVAGAIGVTGGVLGVLLTTSIELLYDRPTKTHLVETPSESETSRSSESPKAASDLVLHPPVKAPWRSSQKGSSLLSQTIHEEDSV